MKIVLLAGANCIHTIRWANGLVSRGVKVYLISVHENTYKLDDRVHVYILKNKTPFGYITAMFEVRKLLKQIQPNLVNAHYATGYGLLARLLSFRPTLLSVWGDDVYEFPEKSFLHRWLLKDNLKSATSIASTSHCMERRIKEIYYHSNIFITPFGIDEVLFSPKPKPNNLNGKMVIGTVKTLQAGYGIDILIKAFAKVWERLGRDNNIYLEISGEGPDLNILQKLAKSLNIFEQVTFHGKINHTDVPKMLNRLDIYCAFSRSESFGVAILEASACEKPVVVSDADGLVEVTFDGKTGLVVPKEDVEASANAIIELIQDEKMRKQMGKLGRQHILENYTWDKSLDLMINSYKQTILY